MKTLIEESSVESKRLAVDQAIAHASDTSQEILQAILANAAKAAENRAVGLHVSRLASWEDIAGLEHTWNKLLASSASQTVFLTWEWVQAWWRAFGSTRHLVLLTCRDAEGDLVAIVPLQRTWENIGPGMSGWMLRLVGDGIGGSENLDWIVRRGHEAAAVRAVLDWLEENRSEWDTLELNTVPAHSPVAAALRHELAVRRWRLVVHESSGYFLRLPDNWETCRASLRKNFRTLLARRIRKLQSSFAVRVRRCETLEELPGCLEQLFLLHAKRWQLRGQKGSFALQQKRAFYAEMGKRLLERGWLDFWLLELDGKTVAAEFGFTYDGMYSFLQAGFDPDYWSYGVGRVLRALIMQELIRRDVRVYDFLGGEDDYKRQWNPERSTYLQILCARPISRGALSILLDEAAVRTKKWLRAHIPNKLWSALKQSYLPASNDLPHSEELSS